MAATLTENRINKLAAARRAVEVCDGGSAGEPGLRLRVFASGAATWSYSYRRKADCKKAGQHVGHRHLSGLGNGVVRGGARTISTPEMYSRR